MIHFGTVLGTLSAVSGVGTFLYGVYRQIKRGIDAVVDVKAAILRKLNEHDEMYGWFSTHVKPKRKSNGVALPQ